MRVWRLFGRVLPIALMAAGCVTAPALESTLEGYQGQEESAVIKRFGQPDQTYPGQDGLTVLSYGERGGLFS